jgi:NADH-quinone oxidoreductase subunit N
MGPFAAVKERMSFMILLMAAATVLVGNLGALKQTRLRRFMAWSGIAQAGFLMLALSGPNPAARASLAFYLYVYLFANYLTFLVFAVVGRTRGESFESLRGLSAQSPALATALAIAIFSLAGIPPMAGFLGKFGLLRSAALGQHWPWVAFFVLNGVLGLYVYLTVLKAAWLDRVEAGVTPEPLKIDFRSQVAILILSVMTIAAGIMPQWHLLAERLWGAP